MSDPGVVIREARPDEYPEAGRVTADAYREFVRDGDDDWHEYLEAIADVEGRADRTTILVALDAQRIVGSATLELFDRGNARATRRCTRGRRTSACWACTRHPGARASPVR